MVKLVIDHVIPVAKGGTNDSENLATSCEDCNLGKGVQSASPDDNSEVVRLSRLQELREQEEVARAAADSVKARSDFKQTIIDAWCNATGRPSVDSRTITTITKYVEQHGMPTVLRWIDSAANKCGHSDVRMGQYISGIRRSVLAEEEEDR